MKPKETTFQQNVKSMLFGMGARQVEKNEGYDIELDTLAGLLQCNAHDDWLATRFDDPKAAALIIPGGSLNTYSGKWNWHYTKPGSAEIKELAGFIAAVLVSDADMKKMGYGRGTGANTEITYMYRDAANYKESKSVVVEGRVTEHQAKAIAACCEKITESRFYFIPGQVGLDDLQEGKWDNDLDHPYHTITSIRCTDLNALGAMTMNDLVAAFIKTASAGWDDAYKPERYMARDHRETSEAAI